MSMSVQNNLRETWAKNRPPFDWPALPHCGSAVAGYDGARFVALQDRQGLAAGFLRTVSETTGLPVVSDVRQFIRAKHWTAPAETAILVRVMISVALAYFVRPTLRQWAANKRQINTDSSCAYGRNFRAEWQDNSSVETTLNEPSGSRITESTISTDVKPWLILQRESLFRSPAHDVSLRAGTYHHVRAVTRSNRWRNRW